MKQIPEIPTQVRIPIRAEETVESFCRRALTQVALEAGLPVIEQSLFVEALIAQYPDLSKTYWLGNGDPTKRTDTEVRTEDFNFKLFLEYLREHPGAGKRKVSIKQVKPLEGRVIESYTPDEITRNELTLWQQDFIYRGGELGTGREAPISRQGLVPALQELATEPDITWIPAIMRSKGWTQGATLMEEWQRRPANIRAAKPEDVPNNFGPPVLNVVKMDWILSGPFDWAETPYNELMNNKMWKTENAKKLLGKRLRETGVIAQLQANREAKVNFGDLTSSNVIKIEEVYIQSKPVNRGNWDSYRNPDGLTAAIKDFNYRMAVKGEAKYTSNGIEVTIQEVGVYAKETYDFINDDTNYPDVLDNQQLGSWSYEDGSGNVGFVSNDSFNNWRKETGKGGDFLVYSDIKVTRLNPPDIYIVPF
jgi:hypothetical protein